MASVGGSGAGPDENPRPAIEAFVREITSKVRRSRVTLRRPSYDKDISIQRLALRVRGRAVVTGREGFLEIDEIVVDSDGCDPELAAGLFITALDEYQNQDMERSRAATAARERSEKRGRQLQYRLLASRLGRHGPHLACGRSRKPSARRKK